MDNEPNNALQPIAAKTRLPLNASVMRKSGILVLVALAACNAQQPPTAFEHCRLESHAGWSSIDPPLERAEIIKIPLTTGRYQTVGEQLLTASIEREAWFRNSNGILAACVYTPSAMDACEGGTPRMLQFEPTPDGWEIVGGAEIACLD